MRGVSPIRGDDLLLWVGKQFYPRKEDFIEEARVYGCCKKIPNNRYYGLEGMDYLCGKIRLGETRAFLAYKEDKQPIVFAYFTIDGIITCSLQQTVVDSLRSGVLVKAIVSSQRRLMPQRRCGQIDPPSYYIVGPEDITCQLGFREGKKRGGPRIVVLEPPLEVVLPFFRGYKWVDGDALLSYSSQLDQSI